MTHDFKLILLLTLLVVKMMPGSGPAFAQPMMVTDGQEFETGSRFRLTQQQTIFIKKSGGGDIGITNSTAQALLIPNHTQAEIEAFQSNRPVGVSICHRQDGGWSGWVAAYCKCSPSILAVRTRTCSNPAPSCGGSCNGRLEERYIYNCPAISCPPFD